MNRDVVGMVIQKECEMIGFLNYCSIGYQMVRIEKGVPKRGGEITHILREQKIENSRMKD